MTSQRVSATNVGTNMSGGLGTDDGACGWQAKKAATTMKKTKSSEARGQDSSSQLIEGRIKELSDWRGETLARARAHIESGRGRTDCLLSR